LSHLKVRLRIVRVHERTDDQCFGCKLVQEVGAE
jgi:hypothetical protein